MPAPPGHQSFREVAPLVRLLLALVITVVAGGVALPATAAAGPANEPRPLPGPDAPERRMLTALNAARAAQGLAPVAWSPELGAAAALHSADMAANDYLEHESLDGATPRDRAARAGYQVPPGTGWLVVEAISAMPTVEAALGWLLSDDLHRRVLLRPIWREVGIGYARGGSYGNYWTLDFGCRPNVLPVFAALDADGKLALTFTNETCAISGGGPDQMGYATEMILASSRDFRDGAWEPFVESKQIQRPAGETLNIRFRDASGRQSLPVRLSLATLQASIGDADQPAASPVSEQRPAAKRRRSGS